MCISIKIYTKLFEWRVCCTNYFNNIHILVKTRKFRLIYKAICTCDLSLRVRGKMGHYLWDYTVRQRGAFSITALPTSYRFDRGNHYWCRLGKAYFAKWHRSDLHPSNRHRLDWHHGS